MKKNVVTLFSIASSLGLSACNNAGSDVNAVSIDSDASAARSYMLTAIKATFGRYEGGFCILKESAVLSVSSIEYNSGDHSDKSTLIKVKANDGVGVKKIEGTFNDRDNRQPRKISVSCAGEILKKDYTLSCNDWKVSQGGKVISETGCAFLNQKNLKNQAKQAAVESVVPSEVELGPTIELGVEAYLKPRKEDNSVAPQESLEIAYCVVKKGFYRIKEEKILEGSHYRITLVEKVPDSEVVAAFKPGRVNDLSKEACQGLSFYVFKEHVVKGE